MQRIARIFHSGASFKHRSGPGIGGADEQGSEGGGASADESEEDHGDDDGPADHEKGHSCFQSMFPPRLLIGPLERCEGAMQSSTRKSARRLSTYVA